MSIDRQRILNSIRLPDGRTAEAIEDSVHLVSRAVPAEAVTERWWEMIPIEATVDHPLYDTLRFGYRLIDGPPPVRELALKR